jgi:phytoene dehydrogenase-like protein
LGVTDCDVAIVGAGHNALIAGAYLAQAGYRVEVFERRGIAGGAVSTEERFPGYRIDLGGSAHILIRLTPIVEELGLERFGLEYLELDPLFFSPGEDGSALFIYRDLERTVDHLESLMPGEGAAYRRFVADWTPFARAAKDAFLAVPSPFELGKRFLRGGALGRDWVRSLRTIFGSANQVLDRYFRDERLRAPMAWMAAQSGPAPHQRQSAPFLLWHPLYHEGGIARPRGGSGMLTQALAKHIESQGGQVHLNAPVRRIVVERGRAVGIETEQGGCTARAVLSGAHALETFGRLLPEAQRPASARRMRPGNGFGAMLRLALREPVAYPASPGRDARVGLQLLCRDRAQIAAAHADYLRGDPAGDPPLVAMTFSAVDDSLAPPGGEVLWLWGQYFPYELSGGRSWDDIGDAVADSLLDAYERYAPGTREKVVGQLFQHPLALERELGLPRGNVMHLEMTLDQMFALRPALGMSGYRAHLPGLYLTGASTHPGGGIMGASGRNAARVLLGDLERRRV